MVPKYKLIFCLVRSKLLKISLRIEILHFDNNRKMCLKVLLNVMHSKFRFSKIIEINFLTNMNILEDCRFSDLYFFNKWLIRYLIKFPLATVESWPLTYPDCSFSVSVSSLGDRTGRFARDGWVTGRHLLTQLLTHIHAHTGHQVVDHLEVTLCSRNKLNVM